jgi:DNA-binding PadR family transcriptional regulator
MARDSLGSFEFQILSVLQQQPDDAYGAKIQSRIAERTGRDASVGALYTALDRLEKKGFVSSWWGESTPERGGRRKRHYKIEASGIRAVQRTAQNMEPFVVRGVLAPKGA